MDFFSFGFLLFPIKFLPLARESGKRAKFIIQGSFTHSTELLTQLSQLYVFLKSYDVIVWFVSLCQNCQRFLTKSFHSFAEDLLKNYVIEA